MIFTTVGTTHFDRLTRCVDEAVASGIIGDETILQIGYGGAYVPRACRYLRGAPSLEPFERAADLIIGHGGTGTTLEILLMGKPLISVSNPSVSDNHQHEFLEALEHLGLVTYCRDIGELPALIASRSRHVHPIARGSRLAQELSGELARVARRRRRQPGVWTSIAERLARRSEIDVVRTIRPPASLSVPTDLLIDPRPQPASGGRPFDRAAS